VCGMGGGFQSRVLYADSSRVQAAPSPNEATLLYCTGISVYANNSSDWTSQSLPDAFQEQLATAREE
jgi:hypothetical protein